MGCIGEGEAHGVNPGLETGEEARALIAALQEAVPGRRWTPVAFARGDRVLVQGDRTEGVHILLEGLLKLTYTTPDGQEWIKSVVADEGIFAGGEEVAYGAEALEPCTVVRLADAAVADPLARPEVRAAHSAFLGWMARRKQAREAALLCLSAEARNRDLCRTSGPILSRLPQGDIARYLGITPVAFSRIKRRIAAGAGQGATA